MYRRLITIGLAMGLASLVSLATFPTKASAQSRGRRIWNKFSGDLKDMKQHTGELLRDQLPRTLKRVPRGLEDGARSGKMLHDSATNPLGAATGMKGYLDYNKKRAEERRRWSEEDSRSIGRINRKYERRVRNRKFR